MSDWELVSVNKKKPKQENSDWEIAKQEMPDNESKGFGGIASDAYNKAIDTALNIPGQLLNLPGEIYGAGKQVITEPKRALKNVGAGFGELGHGILSSLGNTRDYLQKKGIVSENAPSFRLPESVLPKEYNYPEAFGVQGEQSGDTLLRGLPTTAALSPLSELTPYIKSGISKLKPESPYHFIQKAYDIKEKSLSDIFSDVSKEANKDNIKIDLPRNLINEIKKSGPKTDRFNTFVDKSKAGDYDALRKLQTELFNRGKTYKASPLGSEQDFGAHLFEQRGKVNDAIIKALEKAGRPDLSSKLLGAREGWRDLEDLYHSNPVISKLVGDEREVPFTFNPLRKESKFIKNLKEEHPEIDKKLRSIRRAKQLGGIATALGAKKLYQSYSNPYYDNND
jgi:hypothetical protein